jgi:predicted DNA-binding transcriptional regulator AlpA
MNPNQHRGERDMKTTEDEKPRLLTREEVREKTGLSNGSFHRALARGIFPLPINMGLMPIEPGTRGRRPVMWIESEVLQWLKENDPLTRMERVSYRSKEGKR